ncbi:MAG TPA: aldo/keto reductase [Solirubrobacteraceae bacterium]|nr:aldo/keto reductase [Solirubrobacteraceae bacterium]
MTAIPSTDLDVFPLCLGGNVFGWTADRDATFAVLDAYAEAGGNFVDTADSYSHWVPGHRGGESEALIGEWLQSRGNRDRMVVATKVFSHPDRPGLSAPNIRAAAEDSLRRLRTDRIDLYYAHHPDPDIPAEETLGAFDELVRAGKVRYVAVSNHSPSAVAHALSTSEREGLPRYVASQDEYNLMERAGYENGLRDVVEQAGMAELPYFGLARGFLTGKYRPGGAAVDSPRAGAAMAYLDARGERVLAALDAIAAEHETTVAAVALGWLVAQPTVVAAIASARTVEQLADLLPVAQLHLSDAEVARLTAASES